MIFRTPLTAAGLALAACSGAPAPASQPAPVAAPVSDAATIAPPAPRTMHPLAPPVAPADAAFRRGWMPLALTGITDFAVAHPTWDGRGVLVAILDSGIDPTVPGLATTSTGEGKVIDLRDFSGEGAVALTPITARGDTAIIAGQRLAGLSRARALSAEGPWYGGAIRELVLGDPAAADLNADGDVNDTLAVIVTRAPDGWVMFADLGGDGSIANDRPMHDYLVARESFGWALAGAQPYVAVAANFAEDKGRPLLELYFDTSAHGTHVAGIAAGHDLYGVPGFDGVAPGAQLIGLKIADDAQGGISRTGSMLLAMDYAIRFAERRKMPLVMNMSFGVGNEVEGTAVMDRLVDSVLALHPDVVFTLSAGNEGPGLSTVGFPGSARRVISVGALFPGLFLSQEGETHPPADAIADFSSRGGEVAAPHLITPGVAYSTVPLWNRGGEREAGTSMAAPHAAGLAARLLSAAAQEKKSVTAGAVRQALMVTAQPLQGPTFIDQGAGVPNLGRAWAWLANHGDVPAFGVAAHPGMSGALVIPEPGRPIAPPRFTLHRGRGSDAIPLKFRSNAPWLTAPANTTISSESLTVDVPIKAAMVAKPGVHVGVVSAWGPDTTMGPLARLVTTVVVPHRSGQVSERGVEIHAGALARFPFVASRGRPFSVRVSTSPSSMGAAIAYLHEPDGMPYRGGQSRPTGEGDHAAAFDVLSQDALGGVYELVVLASPFADAAVDVSITQAPVSIAVRPTTGGLEAAIRNVTGEGVQAELGAAAIGAVRTFNVMQHGSARHDIDIAAPSWARGIQVEVAMPREAWSRFTDFGVTLFDSAGAQLGKAPLNYALGRLEHEIQPVGRAQPLRIGLFPGFASPADTAAWSAEVTVRFYADSARPLAAVGQRALGLGAHDSASVAFTASSVPEAPAGFHPLGLVLVRTGDDEVWASEAILAPGSAGTQ